MDYSSSHVYIATIGNLSENKKENSLRLSLENLFTKWLRIQITTNDININSSQGKKAAIIHLRSGEAAQCVQHNLSTREGRQKLRFNFLQLVDPYVDIIVDVKHVKQESNVQHDTCYVLGEKIGSESRNREFKRGGGKYAYDHLKTDVGVYVCAFLNSEEEGTLFIGVNDEGTVEGIECEQRKEDIIRKDIIDPGIRAIKPDIFPKSYTVKFTHVCDKNKWQIGNLKVIEITVKKVEQLTQLYEVFDGKVYIRRDGSKQGPLKLNQIQEWHNQKNNRVMQQRLKSAKTRGERETGQLMARLDEKDQMIEEKVDRIKEKEDRIKEKEDRIKEKEERLKEKEERIQLLEKQNNEMARAKSRLGHRIDDTEKQMEEEKKILEQKLEEGKKSLEQKVEEEKKILEQKVEEEKKIIEQQMKEEQITLKQKMEQEKEILEQKMEQEKTTAEQKIRNMEKREKKFKQHISNLKKDIQKFEEQHNTTTADKAALEQRITVNEQEKIELARRAEELENEKMRLEHQIENTKTEVEQSKTMSSGVDEDRKLLEQHVEDMYLKMKQLEEDIDTTEEEKSRLQQKNDDMRLENKRMEDKIKNVEEKEKKLKDKILAEENERKTIEKETEEDKTKLDMLEAKIKEMELEKKTLEEQNSTVKEQSSKIENRPDLKPTKLVKKQNEKSSKTCVIS
ncbi:golgin subfamily A member 6-like protein 6 [Mytilus edulis]|uniref:golgin subfamily A member 6-like protein 6 n=1 Tax=Mytilus edulis TaxID=6550 RepID=UPI0039EECA43